MENPHEQVQNALLSRIISNMVSSLRSMDDQLNLILTIIIGKLE